MNPTLKNAITAMPYETVCKVSRRSRIIYNPSRSSPSKGSAPILNPILGTLRLAHPRQLLHPHRYPRHRQYLLPVVQDQFDRAWRHACQLHERRLRDPVRVAAGAGARAVRAERDGGDPRRSGAGAVYWAVQPALLGVGPAGERELVESVDWDAQVVYPDVFRDAR